MIALEVEPRQVGELADLRRQGRQLIAAEVEPRQVGELDDLRRQGRQLIVTEVELGQVGLLRSFNGTSDIGHVVLQSVMFFPGQDGRFSFTHHPLTLRPILQIGMFGRFGPFGQAKVA